MFLVVGDLEMANQQINEGIFKEKAVNIIFPEMQYHFLGRTEMINIVFLFREAISQDKRLVI